MPQLPVPSVSARIARSNASRYSNSADPNAFGAGVGRAVSALGGQIQQSAADIDVYAQRKQKEKIANAVAQSDFTPYEVKARTEVGSDAAGYRDNVLAKYDQFVEEETNKFEGDDLGRMELRRTLLADRPTISSRAAIYEEARGTDASKLAADASLFSLRNKIAQDPTQYDKYVANGMAVLATRPGMTAGQIAVMQQQFKQDSARARFTGMLEDATSVEDVDAVLADLEDPKKDWASEFQPTDYDWVRNAIDTTKKSMLNLNDSNARAAITTLDERNNALVEIPEDELRLVAQEVKKSRDPIVTGKFARIARDQQYIKQYKGSSATELQQAIDAAGGVQYPGLPPELSSGVNVAVSRFDVSAGYLGALVSRESGGDPNAKASTSSATGLTQFTDATFLEMVKDPRIAARMGVNTAGKSDAELLALRTNPDISIMAGAAYAEKNRNYLESKLGRTVNDTELYMAHFLGPEGAYNMLQAMKTNPSASAASVNPSAAASNTSVFYHKKGKAKSVVEVYNEIARDFMADPSQIAYGDAKTLDTMKTTTEKALKDDPMTFVQQSGKFDVQPLNENDPNSFVLRGNTARAASNYYTIPEDDFKPLTGAEVNDLASKIATGSTDDALAIMSNIQGMGGKMAQAAFKQLEQKDKVYAYAAGLAAEGGSTPAAGDVIRGRKRLEENPALKESVGPPGDVSNMFSKITGGALFDVAPDQRQAIQDAALAHYAETYLSRGGTGLDEQKFGESVNAVLGGSAGSPVLANINGAPAVLPPGVTEEGLNTALDNMAIEDWIAMSPQKTAPMYITGEIANPSDLANEAQLRSVGGGMYKVMMDDGSFLTTGIVTPQGKLEAYLFQPTAQQLDNINTKTAAAATAAKPDTPAFQGSDPFGFADPRFGQ